MQCTDVYNALIKKMLRHRYDKTHESLYEKSAIRPFKLLCLECLVMEAIIRNPELTTQPVSEHVSSHPYDIRNARNVNPPLTRLRGTHKRHQCRYLALLCDYKEQSEMIDKKPTHRTKKKAMKRLITSQARLLMSNFIM